MKNGRDRVRFWVRERGKRETRWGSGQWQNRAPCLLPQLKAHSPTAQSPTAQSPPIWCAADSRSLGTYPWPPVSTPFPPCPAQSAVPSLCRSICGQQWPDFLLLRVGVQALQFCVVTVWCFHVTVQEVSSPA